MRSRSSQILASTAACGLLCSFIAVRGSWKPELDESLDGADEVNLLQERVLQQHLSKKLVDTNPAVERETKTPNICDDVTAEVSSLNLASVDEVHDEPQPTREAPTVESVPLVDNTEVGRAVSASNVGYATILRYALDFLIGLLLLDRLRCWCTPADKAESGDEAASSVDAKVFQQMMRAMAAGDEAGARELLRQGSSVTDKDFWGCTLLHAAAKGGCSKLVVELIALGAQVDATDSWDETPLHVASRAGHVCVCEALVSRGASVDALNAQSFTPLVVAGSAERKTVALTLLHHRAGVGEVARSDLPPLLRELLIDSNEGLQEEARTQLEPEEYGDARQWPTDEDWENHMKDSIDHCVSA